MPQKTARIVNPHFHALPNELQMLVFRKYLNTGDEDVCMLVRAQKNAAMAVKNSKAAFVGLKKIKKMHAAQNKNFARAGFPLH